MTDLAPVTPETCSFRSTDAVLLFSRRALTAIHHATSHGLFTQSEASAMANRVRALTAEVLLSLTTESTSGIHARLTREAS
ncbi:hypothetical protein [Amycolatopsis sp. lyj-90]|uniref:hypothetical protein n=1 Tax=Amycolatopsis sp. lyj-90 TaxID=2789285 RepID=UPI00397D3E25